MARERTAIVGRNEQWDALNDVVQHATSGALVLLCGATGSGKTVLLNALQRAWTRRRTTVLTTDECSAPAIVDSLLAQIRAILDERPSVALLDAVAALSRLRSNGRGKPDLEVLPLMHELTRAIAHLARRQRTVLIIENIDRTTPGTSTALSILAQGVRAANATLIASASDATHPAVDRLARAADSIVELPPLSREDVAALIAKWGPPADNTLVEALRHGLGPLFGNPRTALTTVAFLYARGRLTVIDEHLCLRGAGEPVELRSDHPLLAAIDRVGQPGRKLAAAVAASDDLSADDLPLLAEAAGLDVAVCGRALDQLTRAEVLRVGSNGVLELAVPALTAALHDETTRRNTHTTIARRLIETGRAADRRALADHAAQAGPQLFEARNVLIRGADAVVAQHPAQALDWYRSALAHTEPADESWPRLVGLVARLQVHLGRFAQLADEFAAVARDHPGQVDGHLADATAWWLVALLHEERLDDVRVALRLLGCLTAEVERKLDELFEASLEGQVVQPIEVLPLLTTALAEKSGAAVDLIRLMCALATRCEDFYQALGGRCGLDEATAQDVREAASWRDHATAVELITGRSSVGGAMAHYQRILRAYRVGDWDAALALTRELEAANLDVPLGTSRYRARAIAAEICAQRGELERAQAWMAPAADAPGPLLSWVRCGMAHQEGDTERALELGWRAFAQRSRTHPVGWERVLARLAYCHVQLDDRTGAERAMTEAAALDAEVRSRSTTQQLKFVRGLVRGCPAELAESVNLAKLRRDAYAEAMSCLALGELDSTPERWLHQAYELANRFGRTWYARDRLQRLMQRRGVAPPRYQARDSALSATELQIVDLVSDGLTNRQIALAVRMSEKAVEAHLTRLFARIGCRSRVELAAARLEGRIAGVPA
ncbi:helix-turn-helix transcriptional regulator [Saccharopolyspora thermophila]|uniref:HTH luxR-type domain-containing protein n=1 Tax=Saccharopolyspora thermophila TaxID=89367 RepID=A0ABN1C650_9PSEU